MEKATQPIVQSATCNGCKGTSTYVWPAGLTVGRHKEVTVCPCGQRHHWIAEIR